MTRQNAIKFASAYRQLTPEQRAFVDDFCARVEVMAERRRIALFDALGEFPTEALSVRDQDFAGVPIVQSAVYERIRDMQDAESVSPRRVLRRVVAYAFRSIEHFRDEYGNLTLDLATPDQLATVKKFEEIENVNTGKIQRKIELCDDNAMLRFVAQGIELIDKDNQAINPDVWREAGVDDSVSVEAKADEYHRLIHGDE